MVIRKIVLGVSVVKVARKGSSWKWARREINGRIRSEGNASADWIYDSMERAIIMRTFRAVIVGTFRRRGAVTSNCQVGSHTVTTDWRALATWDLIAEIRARPTTSDPKSVNYETRTKLNENAVRKLLKESTDRCRKGKYGIWKFIFRLFHQEHSKFGAGYVSKKKFHVSNWRKGRFGGYTGCRGNNVFYNDFGRIAATTGIEHQYLEKYRECCRQCD